jgi:hypothetical protein
MEAETGRGADALDRRPQLAAALAAVRAKKCAVLVSKLDRSQASGVGALSDGISIGWHRSNAQTFGADGALCARLRT